MTAAPRPGAPVVTGPKSRLKPLIAALVVVVVGAAVFLLVRGNGDDGGDAVVAGKTQTRSTTTVAPSAGGQVTTTIASAQTAPMQPTTSLPAATQPSLTATQQRELCHVALVGQVQHATDTGDPLDACTTADFVAVSTEVGTWLHGSPGTDYRAQLTTDCAQARSMGRNPLACEGIPTS
jgi:hypothetical protein